MSLFIIKNHFRKIVALLILGLACVGIQTMELQEEMSKGIGNVIINTATNNTNDTIIINTKERSVTIRPGETKQRLNLFVNIITLFNDIDNTSRKVISIIKQSETGQTANFTLICDTGSNLETPTELRLYATVRLKNEKTETIARGELGYDTPVLMPSESSAVIYIDITFAGDNLEQTEIDLITGFGAFQEEPKDISEKIRGILSSEGKTEGVEEGEE